MTHRYPTVPVTAIVPLGGSGTRLYPVTLKVPKHLAPIANRSIFHAASEQYARQGVRTFILGVTGYDNRVQSYSFFGHGGRFNALDIPKDVDFFYATYEDREYRNKGSADVFLWALENYTPIISDNDILLINGDNLSDLSFESFYDAHKRRNALLTIAVKGLEQDDPLLKGFGTVAFNDRSMEVTAFKEKSSEPASRYTNTAICLFSPRVYDVLASSDVKRLMNEASGDSPRDVGKHLIPTLVDLRLGVYAYPLSGAWSDIGTPHSYRVTTNDILHGQYPHIQWRNYTQLTGAGDVMVHGTTKRLMGDRLKGVKFEGKCIVGSNVKIGHRTSVKNSVIGANIEIGENVHIDGITTLFPYVRVEDGARVSNSIVGYDTTIGKNCVVGAGVVLGHNLSIPDGFEMGVDWRVAGMEHMDEVQRAGYKVEMEFNNWETPAFVFREMAK